MVILKFKMATILYLIWSISPPAGRDSKMISKCVCIAPYYVRPDLKSKVVRRLGELNVAMAALRAIGVPMENSRIYDAWM